VFKLDQRTGKIAAEFPDYQIRPIICIATADDAGWHDLIGSPALAELNGFDKSTIQQIKDRVATILGP
jgi:hypothetical protein